MWTYRRATLCEHHACMIQTCINFIFRYHPATTVMIINRVSVTQALKHLNVCVTNKYIVCNIDIQMLYGVVLYRIWICRNYRQRFKE